VVLVQTVEHRPGHRQDLLVVADHREAAQRHVQGGCLRRVVALVIEVGLVHDQRHLPSPPAPLTGNHSQTWQGVDVGDGGIP
jgi:hypothetical protein